MHGQTKISVPCRCPVRPAQPEQTEFYQEARRAVVVVDDEKGARMNLAQRQTNTVAQTVLSRRHRSPPSER